MEKKELKESKSKPIEVEDEIGRKYVSVLDEHFCEVYPDLAVTPLDWHFPLWEMYNESLAIEEAVQDQHCYTQETFVEALLDPEYMKLVLVVDKVPMGMIMGTTNLDKAKVAYVNPEFLRKKFPEEAKKGKILYMTCVFISSKTRNLGFLGLLMQHGAKAVYQKCDVFVSDASDQRWFMKDVVVHATQKADTPVEREEILGRQTYFALVLDKTRNVTPG